jgi:hypothetical protein
LHLLLIPEQVAPLFWNDGLLVPINCHPAFRSILAHHSGIISYGGVKGSRMPAAAVTAPRIDGRRPRSLRGGNRGPAVAPAVLGGWGPMGI